jgi:chromosomal replication initiation ATPase DnaA
MNYSHIKEFKDRLRQATNEIEKYIPLEKDSVLSRSRKYAVIKIRYFLFNYLYNRGLDYQTIGAIFGYDHSTVLSDIREWKAHFSNYYSDTVSKNLNSIADYYLNIDWIPPSGSPGKEQIRNAIKKVMKNG